MDMQQINQADKFIEKQRKLCPLSDASVACLLSEMEEVSFSKGDFVLREGQRNNHVFFVKRGFVRVYVIRNDKDSTLWFASDGELVVTTPGIMDSTMSIFHVEVSEKSILFKIPRQRMEELFAQSLELSNWGRKLMERELLNIEHYFTNYSWSDAKKRYELLIQERPELLQKVPLKQIASYLGVTPQSLSRIRARND